MPELHFNKPNTMFSDGLEVNLDDSRVDFMVEGGGTFSMRSFSDARRLAKALNIWADWMELNE